MAPFASHFRMCAGQRKVRLLTVVELPDVPAVSIVTIGALLTQTALVNVVLFVTVVACLAGAFVAGRYMALHAWNRHVQSDQWETAQIVIERNIIAPTVGRMALIAVLAELARMHVLCAVTAAAIVG